MKPAVADELQLVEVDGGRWRCTGQPQPHDRVLDRLRRLARARNLDQLEDGRRALELAWIHVQVSDDERLAGLEVIGRRHRELVALELRRAVDTRRPPRQDVKGANLGRRLPPAPRSSAETTATPSSTFVQNSS